MTIVNILNDYMQLLLITLVIIIFGVVGIAIYLLRVKKIASTEEIINYNSFNRVDSKEYAKFEDIVSSGGPNVKNSLGMICVGNNTFVGGIQVSGYNYHSASAEEKERTMINTIAFFNIIEHPIQLRQTVQAIDISYNIKKEEEFGKKIERELYELNADYQAAVNALENTNGDDALADAIEKRLDALLHTMHSKEWQLKEAREMVGYMKAVSDVNNNSKKINQIMFSYVYNPNDDIEELSKEEIYLKAEKELMNYAQIYGSALENCGCTWRVLSADDLTNLVRRHYHPETVDDIRLEELMNSTYRGLYVTTDSLEELERERRGELAFEKEMEELERQRIENERIAREQLARAVEEMEREAAAVMD